MRRKFRIGFGKRTRPARLFVPALLILVTAAAATFLVNVNAALTAQLLPAERLAKIETSAGRTAASMYYEVRAMLREGRLDAAAFTLSVLTPVDEPGPAISNMHAALLLLRGEPADRAAAYDFAQRAVRLAPTVGEFQIMRALAAPGAMKSTGDGAVRLSRGAVEAIEAAIAQLDPKQGNARWIAVQIRQLRADDSDPEHPFLFARLKDLAGIALISPIGKEEAVLQTAWVASRYAESQEALAEALRKKRILEIQRNLILKELEDVAPNRRRLLELELDEVEHELRVWQAAIERHERELVYLASAEQLRVFQAKQEEILSQETTRLTAEMDGIRETYQKRIAQLEAELIEARRQVFVVRAEYAALQDESNRRIAELVQAREHFQYAAGRDGALLRQLQARLARVETVRRATLVEQDMALAQREVALAEARQKVAMLEMELARRDTLGEASEEETMSVIAGLQRELDAARAELLATKQALEDSQELHRRTALRLEEESDLADYELTNLQQLIVERDETIGALQIQLVELKDSDRSLHETRQNLLIAEDRLILLNKTRREIEGELERYRSELGLAQERYAQLSQTENELARSRQELELLRAQLADSDARAGDLAKTKERLAAVIEELETTKAALEAARFDVRRYANLVREVDDKSEEIAELKVQLAEVQAGKATASGQIAEADRALAAAAMLRTDGDLLQLPDDVRWGRYYALVIGNNDYQNWNTLSTPVKDARAVAEAISRHFGFQVELLENATRAKILSTLEEYERTLRYDDNLLIYYAGHGQIVHNRGIGYWIPIDAEVDSTVDWISDDQLRRFMKGLRAKQVMIVADSCFSGTLANEERAFGYLARIETAAGGSPEAPALRGQPVQSAAVLRRMLQGRARVVLSSGGERPVVDEYGEDGHSIFASAFIKVLNETREPINGSAVAARVSELVSSRILEVPSLTGANYTQDPRFETLSRSAGHDLSADFIFAPTEWLRTALSVKTGLIDRPAAPSVDQ